MSECADNTRDHLRKTRTTAVLAGAALLAPLGLLAATGNATAADSGVWDRIAQCESGGDWHIKMEIEKDGRKIATPPCKILDFVENERLAISWPDWRGDKSVPDQRVLWKLTPEGAGTRVELVHDGFIRAVDVSDYPFGWGYFLSRISDAAQGKPMGPPPDHDC